jgi:hypothetical protein
MRIDSGLQGYYYDQGRFKRPEIEGDDPASQGPAAQPARAQPFAPVVESSTVLSSTLSGALWALESRDRSGRNNLAGNLPLKGASDEETAGKVNAYYLQYTDDDDTVAA